MNQLHNWLMSIALMDYGWYWPLKINCAQVKSVYRLHADERLLGAIAVRDFTSLRICKVKQGDRDTSVCQKSITAAFKTCSQSLGLNSLKHLLSPH